MTCLPGDILYIICTQLWHQRDFDTLFNCACAGKQLATMVIPHLYRMQAVAPTGDSSNALPAHDLLGFVHNTISMRLASEPGFLKCVSLWRTIILSSLGKTLYPYSQYIRTLNLRDLEELLQMSGYRAGTFKDLLRDELARFKADELPDFFTCEPVQSSIDEYDGRLDAVRSASRIGEAITKQTPLLEELAGKVPTEVLSRWIPRLPRLTHLEPWQPAVFNDNGSLIRLHCPSFKSLHLRDWNGGSSDLGVAAFLNELRPQSLESFKTFSDHSFRPDISQALSCHGESLVELKLIVYPSGTVPNVLLLKRCTNLVSLSLVGCGPYISELANSDEDAVSETVAWLKDCKKLQTLAFAILSFSLAIPPILLENSLHLTSLDYEGYGLRDTIKFYEALAKNTSLQRLYLHGDVGMNVVEADVIVESLSKLVNLTFLGLQEISESFVDRHIVQLARSLPKLEVWLTAGGKLTDAIWGGIATLKSLRRLELTALMSFTTNGVLSFIKKLGPGNKGLVLDLESVDTDCDYWEEQWMLEKIFAKKIGGEFRFTVSAPGYWGESN